MKAPIIETNDPDIRLIEPDIERDARLSLVWLDGQLGHKTLSLMGVPERENNPTSLEKERQRIAEFVARKDQLNWMIALGNKVVGSIWLDLEPTDELPGPALHIIIGDSEARGRGIGTTATQAVIRYMRSRGAEKIYSRRLNSNEVAAKLLQQNGFENLDEPYTDRDGLSWQNVVLTLE